MSSIFPSRRRIKKSQFAQPLLAGIEYLEDRLLMSTNSWKAAVSGDWDTASNWSAGHVPTSSEDVVISVAGTYTVTHSVGDSDSVHSITTSKPLNFSAGSLTIGTTFTATSTVTLLGGTIIGGTVTAGSGGNFVLTSGTFQGVTLGSNLTIPAAGILYVQKALNLNGHNITLNSTSSGSSLYCEDLSGETTGPTINGSGEIIFGGTSPTIDNFYAYDYTHATTISTGVTLVGPGAVSIGYASPGGLVNDGSIVSNTSGKAMTFGGTGVLTNNGTVSATSGGDLTLGSGLANSTGKTISITGGGTLALTGVWTNSGTISQTSSILNLGGTFTKTGTITRSAGTVNLTGTYNLGGGTLAFTSTTGSWNLDGGTLENAVMTSSGGAYLLLPAAESGTFYNVTLGATFNISATAMLYVEQAINLDGFNIDLNSTTSGGGGIYFETLTGESTGPSLTGTGALVLQGTTPISNNVYAYDYLHPTTFAAGVTLKGAGSVSIGYASPGGLTSAGTIEANTSGQALTIGGTGVLTNNGSILAASGGTMTIGSGLSNSTGKTISVTSGSTLALTGVWSNSGTLNESSGTLNLGGTFTKTGTITRSAGLINLTGTYNLAGGTVAFNSTTGSWNLSGGTLENATITNANGAGLQLATGTTGTFENVKLGAAFTIPGSSTLYVEQSLNLNGFNVTLNSSSAGGANLYFETLTGESTGPSVTGTGDIILGGTSPTVNNVYAYDYLHPVNLASTVILEGAGSVGIGYAAPGGLISAGSILANVSGQTITIDGAGTLTNNGSISTASGGDMNISSPLVNSSGKTILASGAGTLTLSGAWSNSGTITDTSSTLDLGGTFSKPSTVTRTAGTINLTGTYNAAGGTVAFTATTGVWNLDGGTLENAIISETGGGALQFGTSESGTFYNVTLGADFTISGGNTLYVEQALNLNGHTLNLSSGSSNAILYFEALNGETTGASLTGTGTVDLTGATPTNNTVYVYDYLHPVAIGSGVTLEGVGIINVGYASPGGLNNSGTILVNSSGKTLTIQGAGPFTNYGTINISSGATLAVSNTIFNNSGSGIITGIGKLTGNVSNSAVIQAGSPLFGTLNITGNLTETSTGSIKVELGGSATTSYNKLAVSGKVTLAGIVDIYTVSGYVPTSGTTFSVVSFGSETGTIGTDGTSLSSTIVLTETTSSTGISLKAGSAPADTTAPTVTAFTTSNTNTSSSTFTFTVTYSDNIAISIASLGNGNLKVTGPGGFSAFATLVSVSKSNNGTPRSVVYSISTSAGSGTYTVAAVAGSVKDTKGNALAAGTVGTFKLVKT